MGWDTYGKYSGPFVAPEKPYCVADVRFANGADNDFVEQLLEKLELDTFYGYAGWNTSANTIGTLLATIKARFNAENYKAFAFKRLQMIRFLDDWAYQANIRAKIDKPSGISNLMKPYEEKLSKTLDYEKSLNIEYIYPWNRKFEIEVLIK